MNIKALPPMVLFGDLKIGDVFRFKSCELYMKIIPPDPNRSYMITCVTLGGVPSDVGDDRLVVATSRRQNESTSLRLRS
jgi:hypothetical protein